VREIFRNRKREAGKDGFFVGFFALLGRRRGDDLNIGRRKTTEISFSLPSFPSSIVPQEQEATSRLRHSEGSYAT